MFLGFLIMQHFHREEHKRLGDDCPFGKLGQLQDNYTVKEVLELCQKNLKKFIVSTSYL